MLLLGCVSCCSRAFGETLFVDVYVCVCVWPSMGVWVSTFVITMVGVLFAAFVVVVVVDDVQVFPVNLEQANLNMMHMAEATDTT